jgi:Bacterial PH domain
MRHNAPMQPLVFRSTVARVVAWIFIAFAALNLVDVVIRGRGQSGRLAFAVLIAVALIAFVLGLRPAVIADSRQVLLRNLVRDVSVPWGAVTAIDSTDALRIHAGSAVFRRWSIVAGNRARRRALRAHADATQGSAAREAAAHSGLSGRTHADFVVDQLTEVWRVRRAETGGVPQVRWAWPAVACLAIAALLVVGTAVLG